MKKLLSIILSICMLFSIAATANLSAYAGGWLNYAKPIEFETTYTESASTSDYKNSFDKYYYDILYFSVPVSGNVTIHMESENPYYLAFDGYSSAVNTRLYVYDERDIDNELYSNTFNGSQYSNSRGVYYGERCYNLDKGNYYIALRYTTDGFMNRYGGDTYDITFSYKPNISTPSSFKVSTRNATSLKLTWSKVANVSGYQLQRKSGDSYITVTNTTATSATVSNLATATNYAFRVRAYKTINGKKYYGGWKTLTTPTKPGKVGIKNPTTNSKHQIIAKWNKVTRASGYQVQYCRNSSCSSVIATKTVSGGSKVSYTGKNFTKGKKYYVRVRAYKTVNGTKYFGAWSNVKSIKCK